MAPMAARAQAPSTQLSNEEISRLAKVSVEIDVAHDSTDLQLAMVGNKKPEVQDALKAKLRTEVTAILTKSGMTEAQYKHETFLVSTDTGMRRTFDGQVVHLTGAPLPGAYTPPVGRGGRGGGPTTPPIKVPAGAAGMHIGHVVNSFGDTPGKMGLLPVAFSEARTAQQHASLGMKAANLDGMKLHAGHVLNAMDPTIVAAGPGLGYGMKKAALGVADHIELAAKAPGASQNVILHATHIAMASRNAAARADTIITLAKEVQAATTTDEATKLLSEIVSLCDHAIAGVDSKGDGRVTWQTGGLQQAQEHVDLMLAAEKP
ncbi:MAG TPA: hypothetical protein VGI97_09870 [Gemmatimonadaceae bacterium]|jgi:hypothetical protein